MGDTIKSIASKGQTANVVKNKEVTKEKGIEGWKPDTRHSIAERGETADNLKNEKATKANDPDTVKSIAGKGAKADNLKNTKKVKAEGPDTVKNMDGKAIKNSRGATPNPAGEEAGSYMPDGTPIDGTELTKPAPKHLRRR